MDDKPTCIADFRKLIEQIEDSGRAPISKFALVGRKDAIQAALAWLGLLHGRDVSMLGAIAGDWPRPKPAEEIKFSRVAADGTYDFADEFDELKATIYTELTKHLQ